MEARGTLGLLTMTVSRIPFVLDPEQFQTVIDGLAELPAKRSFNVIQYLLNRRAEEFAAQEKPPAQAGAAGPSACG